ncbi:hypothetical protein SUGI_0623950 [Cryptomeria japonica]|nr:hypothetical protein SUGI_0623950 [Cryptomeria japonica]
MGKRKQSNAKTRLLPPYIPTRGVTATVLFVLQNKSGRSKEVTGSNHASLCPNAFARLPAIAGSIVFSFPGFFDSSFFFIYFLRFISWNFASCRFLGLGVPADRCNGRTLFPSWKYQT